MVHLRWVLLPLRTEQCLRLSYEAAREIRQLERPDASTVRIFACTASTFAEDRKRALESGMDDFLPKPLNVQVMLEKLKGINAG